MTNHRQFRLLIPRVKGIEHGWQYHQQNGDCREEEEKPPVHTLMLSLHGGGQTEEQRRIREELDALCGDYAVIFITEAPLLLR